MKTRLILSLILILGMQLPGHAQHSDSLMRLVHENNLELKAAREALQVAVVEAGTGNAPLDPEVEFAYLFGKPQNLGNRVDFGISQQLDFPTAYVHRSDIRKIRSSRAQVEYDLVRQRVLHRARSLWIEQVYLNQLQSLLEERLGRAKTIHRHVQQMLDAGESSALELGQAQLLVASLEGESEEVKMRVHNNQLALNEMAGGLSLDLSDSPYPIPVKIDTDSLLADYRSAADVQRYQHVRQQREAEKNLAVSEHLPRISAGYFSETVSTESFRGIKVGLSVPLWEKARTVKLARTEIAHAEPSSAISSYNRKKKSGKKSWSAKRLIPGCKNWKRP